MSRSPKSYAALAGGLLLAVTASGCATEADDDATDVDQPSPVDWQSQNASNDRAGQVAAHDRRDDVRHRQRRPERDVDHERHRRDRVVAAPHVPGDLVRHPGHAARVLRPLHAARAQLPDHRLLRAVVGQHRQRRHRADAHGRLGKTFNHYFWVYGGIPSGANCGTWGDEGSPSRIAIYSSYSFHQIVGYAQEIGHNFGMTHEPTMCCGGTVSGNDLLGRRHVSDNTSNCQHMEYGTRSSFMGGGAHHPSAVHKYHQGWMSGCNLVKVGATTTHHAAAAGAPLRRRAAAADPGAQDARPAPGTGGDRPGHGADADALLSRDARAARLRQRHRPDGAGVDRSRSAGGERNAPYVYLLDINPSTTTHQRRRAACRRELQRSGGRLHGDRELDRQRERQRHDHDRPAPAR